MKSAVRTGAWASAYGLVCPRLRRFPCWAVRVRARLVFDVRAPTERPSARVRNYGVTKNVAPGGYAPAPAVIQAHPIDTAGVRLAARSTSRRMEAWTRGPNGMIR
ncbi:hypothetical protein GCM10010412_074900 [Nonomuraea recticatena]|uniref:Uncharacterized protein n=1 Tax=Nonomuraea recticatena TaxID=46178 RepID=A0ABN3SXC2_9ACTN